MNICESSWESWNFCVIKNAVLISFYGLLRNCKFIMSQKYSNKSNSHDLQYIYAYCEIL